MTHSRTPKQSKPHDVHQGLHTAQRDGFTNAPHRGASTCPIVARKPKKDSVRGVREDLQRSKCGAAAARAPGAAHAQGPSAPAPQALGTRRKRAVRGPAVWQMRWGGGGSSAHAGSQRHGSTSFRREASRRQPLKARRARRASTRKINTTQCAPGPAAWRIRRSAGGRAVAAAHEQAASGRAAEAGGMRRLGASRRHAASTGKRDTTRPAAGPAAWQMRGGGGGELGCNSQDQRALQNLAPRGA